MEALSDELKIHQAKARLIDEAQAICDVRKTLVLGGFSAEESFEVIQALIATSKDDTQEEE